MGPLIETRIMARSIWISDDVTHYNPNRAYSTNQRPITMSKRLQKGLFFMKYKRRSSITDSQPDSSESNSSQRRKRRWSHSETRTSPESDSSPCRSRWLSLSIVIIKRADARDCDSTDVSHATHDCDQRMVGCCQCCEIVHHDDRNSHWISAGHSSEVPKNRRFYWIWSRSLRFWKQWSVL